MAITSLSLPQPSLFPPSSSTPSSSSFGGTHLRTHMNFISLTSSSSSSSSSSKFDTRVSAGRFRTAINASGDYYTTLGVPKSASSKEIKTAYRRLARQVLNSNAPFFVFHFLYNIWLPRKMEKKNMKLQLGF